MEILTLHQRGIHHQNFNEDFLYTYNLSEEIIVAAVMDGCSSAKDSQFTSVLYAKSLHKSSRMLPQMKEIVEDFDLETMGLEGIAEFFMNQLFEDLKRTKKLFFLETKEILSTIVLMVYDNKRKKACIKMSGDGLFAVNGEITEVDQNNIPNFLGYHLNRKFDDIKRKEIETWSFVDVRDISISTDGIDKLMVSEKKKSNASPREQLLVGKPLGNKEEFFKDKYSSFVENGFIPKDDIAIIRVICEG